MVTSKGIILFYQGHVDGSDNAWAVQTLSGKQPLIPGELAHYEAVSDGQPLFGLYPNGLYPNGLFMIGLSPFGLPMTFGLSPFGLF